MNKQTKLIITAGIITAFIAGLFIRPSLPTKDIVQSVLAPARLLYVATNGNDSNSGSEASPYKTIAKCASVAIAGDTCLIKGGTYNGNVSPKNSGVAGSPITYKRDGSAPVIIVGSGFAAFDLEQKNYIIVDGLTIIANGMQDAVRIHNSSNNIFQNNDISGACINIAIYSGDSGSAQYGVTTENNIIRNNKVHDTSTSCGLGEGIYIKQYIPSDVSVPMTRNTLVEGNEIYNVLEGVQATVATIGGSGGGDGGIPPIGTIIRNNILHNLRCDDQGIFTVQGDNMVIEGNIIYNSNGSNKCGISVRVAKNLIVRNNVLFNLNTSSSSSRSIDVQGTGVITNNTIYQTNQFGLSFVGGSSLIVKNNIVANTGTQVSGSATLDYNMFSKSGSGLGNHTLIAAPSFISLDPSSPNFMRLQSSAACTAGENGGHMGAFPCGGSIPFTNTPTNTGVPITPSITSTSISIPSTFTNTFTPTLTNIVSTSTPTRTPTTIVTQSSGQAGGVIVPLYTFPSSSALASGGTWWRVAQSKIANPSVKVIAIVNPASGAGNSVSSNYVIGIKLLRDNGVIVLGYTSVDYFNSGNTVISDVDKWKQWYFVDGIFIDEMPNNNNHEQDMRDYTSYIKGKGYSLVVGNPGTDTAESYVGTVDVIMIYESSGLPPLSRLQGWHTNYNKNNFSIIPYGVSSLDTSFVNSAKGLVGYIYITNDTAPNPWDSLPPYFETLVSSLAGNIVSVTNTPIPVTITPTKTNAPTITPSRTPTKMPTATVSKTPTVTNTPSVTVTPIVGHVCVKIVHPTGVNIRPITTLFSIPKTNGGYAKNIIVDLEAIVSGHQGQWGQVNPWQFIPILLTNANGTFVYATPISCSN